MTYDEYEDEEDGYTVMEIPVSPVLKVVRQSDGCEDQDAIEWSEVHRLMYEQMWGPILALPTTKDDFFMKGNWEDGVDVSAFGTHDFKRMHGGFEKYFFALKEAERELKHVLLVFEMVFDRVDDPGKYLVLKDVAKGIIEPGMCEGDMWRAAVWFLRAEAVREKIQQIKDAWWCHRRKTRVLP